MYREGYVSLWGYKRNLGYAKTIDECLPRDLTWRFLGSALGCGRQRGFVYKVVHKSVSVTMNVTEAPGSHDVLARGVDMCDIAFVGRTH